MRSSVCKSIILCREAFCTHRRLISKTPVSRFWAILSFFGTFEIVFSMTFHWCYIHGSSIYIAHIKRNSRTIYVVSYIRGEGDFKVFFYSQNDKQNKVWLLEIRRRQVTSSFVHHHIEILQINKRYINSLLALVKPLN